MAKRRFYPKKVYVSDVEYGHFVYMTKDAAVAGAGKDNFKAYTLSPFPTKKKGKVK